MFTDPVLLDLQKKFKIKEYWGGKENYFIDLLENIIGQQLSVKVAKVIFGRFIALFKTHTPSAEEILAVSHETYRAQGLSNAKARYIKNIAQTVIDKELLIENFDQMTDEEIKTQLVKIKGIGNWTAEMFLIFSMKRPDVFSLGDLGLRTAIEKLYGIKRDNLKKIEKLSKTWAPHRTLACRLLWSSLDNT